MAAGKVKVGRGAVIEDLYGGVLTASDTKMLADEAPNRTNQMGEPT